MSGHSHSSNIAHRKGTVDAQRGKLFSKLCRAIYVAAKNGDPNPDANIRLRYAIDKAKSYSCPKENIERSIKKASGELGGEHFEDVLYEGYGPGGVAVMCAGLTDNRNRTAGEIRKAFEICGGNMGATGCVGYMFAFKGVFLVQAKLAAEDKLTDLVLEVGADDMTLVDDYYEITCDAKVFDTVKKALEDAKVPLDSAETTYIPSTWVNLDAESVKKMAKLRDILDENEDVQTVYANDSAAEID